MRTIHIRPTAPPAPRVLLPGDPGRALALAQELILQPKMSNHHRGLWGYTGSARADGQPLTIQSTGIGGPSAAIVLHELAQLGARAAIRVGTCGALQPQLQLGDVVLAREAIAADGAGARLARACPARREPAIAADPQLTSALQSAAQPRAAGSTVTTDLFYEPAPSRRQQRWANAGVLAVEMEAAALFAVGAQLELAVGCVLAVSDVFERQGRVRIADEQLHDVMLRVGAAAVAALAPRG
ncbi:MAG: phosphorylase family protein [Solirubrobacteraceae bacterium]